LLATKPARDFEVVMTEPRRWIDEGAPEPVERMFEAARAEAPDRRGVQRTMAALGLSVSSAVVSGSTSAASGATLAAKVSGSALLIAAKWGGGGAVVALVVVGAAHGIGSVRSSATTHAEAHLRGPIATMVASSEPSPKAAVPSPMEEDHHRELPPPSDAVTSEPRGPGAWVSPPETVTRAVPRPHPGPVDEAVSADILAKEITVVDRARTALAEGRPREVLALLEEERAESFAQLAPEALYLKMQALLAAGEQVLAARVAGQLLSTYPNTPQARRARAALGSKIP
jgi:hypothetical protein